MAMASEKLDAADRLSELEHELRERTHDFESCQIRLDSATASTNALFDAKAALEAEILQLQAEKLEASREL